MNAEEARIECSGCVISTTVFFYIQKISSDAIWKIHVAYGCHKLGFTNVATRAGRTLNQFSCLGKLFVHDRVVRSTIPLNFYHFMKLTITNLILYMTIYYIMKSCLKLHQGPI